MKWLSLAMVLVFVAAAGVQLNDPDPHIWVPVYLVPAVLSYAAFRGHHLRWSTTISFAAFTIAALWWLPALRDASLDSVSTVAMRTQADEEVREAGGLILGAVWTGVLMWQARRGKPA